MNFYNNIWRPSKLGRTDNQYYLICALAIKIKIDDLYPAMNIFDSQLIFVST